MGWRRSKYSIFRDRFGVCHLLIFGKRVVTHRPGTLRIAIVVVCHFLAEKRYLNKQSWRRTSGSSFVISRSNGSWIRINICFWITWYCRFRNMIPFRSRERAHLARERRCRFFSSETNENAWIQEIGDVNYWNTLHQPNSRRAFCGSSRSALLRRMSGLDFLPNWITLLSSLTLSLIQSIRSILSQRKYRGSPSCNSCPSGGPAEGKKYFFLGLLHFTHTLYLFVVLPSAYHSQI